MFEIQNYFMVVEEKWYLGASRWKFVGSLVRMDTI